MNDPEFLTLAEVLDIHQFLIERHGGSLGVRDRGLLESALAVPEASFGGEYLHPSLYLMAAAYAYHIAENQPFIDGNKRTALGSALVFLEINDIEIDDPNGSLYDAMMATAARKMTKDKLGAILERLG